MNRNHQLFFVLLLFWLFVLITNCNEKDDILVPATTNGTNQPNPDLEGEQEVINILKASLTDTLDNFFTYQGHLSAGGTTNIQYNESTGQLLFRKSGVAYAIFGSPVFGPGIDLGSVAVNNYILQKENFDTGGIIYSGRSNHDDLDRFVANIDRHLWGVSGSSQVPAFEVTLDMPQAFSILEPLSNSQVNLDRNLEIKWQGGTSNIVIIHLLELNSTEDGKNFSMNPVLSEAVPDAGSYIFSVSDLQNLSVTARILLIAIYKYQYKIKTHNGNRFLVSAMNNDLVGVRLEN